MTDTSASEPLTDRKILAATERVLRRYGPTKATVVDVARELGVSHASVYRHFSSKAELRDAVAADWLAEISGPLEKIAEGRGSARGRLCRWLNQLVEAKQGRARTDPELFATYVEIAGNSRAVIDDHVDELVGQLERIIRDGVDEGAFSSDDAPGTARAVFDATSRFHNPANAAAWAAPGIDLDYERVRELVVGGIER